MVEVLKRGTLPSEKEHTCTCSHCYSLLKFKQSEAKVHVDQMSDASYLEITCPVCERSVSHSPYRSSNDWRDR